MKIYELIPLVVIILVLGFIFVQVYYKHLTRYECQTDLPPEPLTDFRNGEVGYMGQSHFKLETKCNGGLLSPYTKGYPIN